MGEAKRRRAIGQTPVTRNTNIPLADFVLGIDKYAGAVPCNGRKAKPTPKATCSRQSKVRRPDGGCIHLGDRGECTVYEHRAGNHRCGHSKSPVLMIGQPPKRSKCW